MKAESSFVSFVLELFAPLGRIRARRMFSGHGLFHEGLMFGLVFQDQLFLKVDAQSQGRFERAGLTPFTYTRQGRQVALSFFRAPDSVFDEPEQAADWGRAAIGAAIRAQAGQRTASARRIRP